MSLTLQEEAILEILFTRLVRPPIRPEEDFIEVRMTNLEFLDEDIEQREPTIVMTE